ncbi:MAG: LysR substrate-binding domain-containing protein, partial [Pseudomonadota bacterium]|nr:LysR substrate-binding domain-containing protein [Pseudomonadota bacterium]
RTRGLALTDAGRKLLPEVGSALEMLSGAAARFDIGAAGDLLTVATSVSIAQWVIAPNLPAFKTQNPEIRLRILSAIWPDDFHASRADVQIRFGSEKQVGAGSQRLLPDHLIAVKSPSLETDFESCPLIETVGTSNGWATWGEANGPVQEPTVFADTYGMALQLAVHGNGVALVSELVAKHAVTSGLVVQAHPGQIESKEGYFLSINEELPAAGVFRDWLRTQLAAG